MCAAAGGVIHSIGDSQDILSMGGLSISRPFTYTAWPLNMGPIGYPETSERNYHHALCNNLEEGRSHLHHGRDLKSRLNWLDLYPRRSVFTARYELVFD